MSDWTELMDDEARKKWDKFVQHFREDALVKMTDSAFVAQLVPDMRSWRLIWTPRRDVSQFRRLLAA